MAPGFAFKLAAKRMNDTKTKNKNMNDLELSSIVSFLNAAEPIQVDSRAVFYETFRPYGPRVDWFLAGNTNEEPISVISTNDTSNAQENLNGSFTSSFEDNIINDETNAPTNVQVAYKEETDPAIITTSNPEQPANEDNINALGDAPTSLPPLLKDVSISTFAPFGLSL